MAATAGCDWHSRAIFCVELPGFEQHITYIMWRQENRRNETEAFDLTTNTLFPSIADTNYFYTRLLMFFADFQIYSEGEEIPEQGGGQINS